MRRSLCAILLFVTLFQPAWAEASVSAEFPFKFHDGFLWVQVNVPQSSKPLQFLLDTGASVSVINLNTARRLELHAGAPVIVNGVESASKGFWPQRLVAKAGNVALSKNYLAVDLENLGQACNCCVDGLIGADFFRGKIVQIDFEAQKVRLLKSSDEFASETSIPLRIRRCGMEIPIQVNGSEPGQVRVDTGCASALQWVTATVQPKDCTQRTAIALSAFTVTETKSDVQIGNVEFKSVQTGLHSKEIFAGESGLLGNGILSRFKTITIDAKKGRLILGDETAVD